VDIFLGLVFFVAFIAFLVFAILTVVALIKKNGLVKRQLICTGGSIAMMFISLSIAVAIDEEDSSQPASIEVAKEEKLTPEEEAAKKEAKEKAEAEARAEKEAEEKAAKEKAEQEAKAKKEAEERKKKEEERKKAEEEARIAAEKAEAEKKANAQPIEYAQLIKNPDRHAGEYVKYTGEIAQIQEGDNSTVIRLAVTQESYGWNPNDIIWVEYDGYTEYVDGDVITVYGEIYGSHTYTSQAGWEITIPAVIAESFE